MAELLRVIPSAELDKRLAAIFWGASGTGKTILAATAPRPILYLSWDIEGWQSVEDATDFHVVNLAEITDSSIVEHFRTYDSAIYKELTEKVKSFGIKTIISDSITKYVSRSMEHACAIGNIYATGNEKGKISIYKPGWTAYGIRTALLHGYISNVGMFASKNKLNCVFIGHEDQPKIIGEGEAQKIIYQTMRLGGDNGFEVPIDVREVWHFSSNKDDFTISLRPFPVINEHAVKTQHSALVKPMKTTMFDATTMKSIIWEKNSKTDRLDVWLDKWTAKKSALTAEDI